MVATPSKPPGADFKLLVARLRGVRGHTGRGVMRCVVWPNGARRFTVKLKGVAGVSADIFVDGARVERIALANGAARQKRAIPCDAPAAALKEGARIEIRQNGDVILEGALSSAAPFRPLRRACRRARILWKISWRARPQFLRIFESRH